MRYSSIMRFPDKAWLVLACALLAPAGRAVPANLKENYQPIVDRNPFGLKPPPPPATNNTAPPPVEKPKVEIFLTGIVSVGYPRIPKRVFLMTKEQNKKDPNYYDLTENVEKDGIKILGIDEVNKKVRIHTDSGETTLSFQTHGVAPPVAPAAIPVPGQPGSVPGQPGVPTPLPGAPQAMQQPANHMYNNAGQPTPLGGNAATPQTNFRAIPSRNVRSRLPGGAEYQAGNPAAVPGAVQGQEAQAPQIDPAEQYLRMHLDKVQKEKQGIQMPPLPPIQ